VVHYEKPSSGNNTLPFIIPSPFGSFHPPLCCSCYFTTFTRSKPKSWVAKLGQLPLWLLFLPGRAAPGVPAPGDRDNSPTLLQSEKAVRLSAKCACGPSWKTASGVSIRLQKRGAPDCCPAPAQMVPARSTVRHRPNWWKPQPRLRCKAVQKPLSESHGSSPELPCRRAAARRLTFSSGLGRVPWYWCRAGVAGQQRAGARAGSHQAEVALRWAARTGTRTNARFHSKRTAAKSKQERPKPLSLRHFQAAYEGNRLCSVTGPSRDEAHSLSGKGDCGPGAASEHTAGVAFQHTLPSGRAQRYRALLAAPGDTQQRVFQHAAATFRPVMGRGKGRGGARFKLPPSSN